MKRYGRMGLVAAGLVLAGCSAAPQAAAPITVTATSTVSGPTVTVTSVEAPTTVTVTETSLSTSVETSTESASPPSNDSQTFTLTGSFLLDDASGVGVPADGSGGCDGINGYDDIADGTSVTVYDESDKVVASGDLENSRKDSGGHCKFDVNVPDVPTGPTFYQPPRQGHGFGGRS